MIGLLFLCKGELLQKPLRDRFFLHTPFDINFILAIVFINVYGLIMIYSASYYYAESAYHYAPDYFFQNQLRWVLLGLAAFILISYVRPKYWQRLWKWALIVSFAFIILVRIPPFAHASHGAYRWIKLGSFLLQIAEPVKLGVIIGIAGLLVYNKVTDKKTLVWTFGISGVFAVLLLFLSSNMSTALIVFAMVYLLVTTIHPKPKGFILFAAGVFVMIVLAVIIVDRFIPFSDEENFRITRIRAWIHPTDERFIVDEAYQSTQALYAIASGGFFGRGLGQSLIKFKLPEPHNDYILAIIFEEMGILGVLILTYLFLYLMYKIFRIFLDTKDRFSRYVVLGVFYHLTVQILLNYAVTLGILPTMGVTLPFISAGGSAAFFTLIELGVVLGISRQNEENSLYMEANLEMEEENPYFRQLKEEGYDTEALLKKKRVKVPRVRKEQRP